MGTDLALTPSSVISISRERTREVLPEARGARLPRLGKVRRLHPRSQAPRLPISRAMSIRPRMASSPAIPRATTPQTTLRNLARVAGFACAKLLRKNQRTVTVATP